MASSFNFEYCDEMGIIADVDQDLESDSKEININSDECEEIYGK
jgi:hypothetical protein